MAIGFDLLALAVYIAVFITAAFKAGQFQWLWASVLLWLGVSTIGARLLPGILGITHLAPLYIPHFYITLASLFFFINHWKKLPEKGWWHTQEAGSFISLFAVSGLLMTTVSALFTLLVYMRFPTGITPYVMPALLQMYALKPAYWFVAQGFIMLVFYAHRSLISNESANRFSSKQIQAGILMAFLFQTAYVFNELLNIRFG